MKHLALALFSICALIMLPAAVSWADVSSLIVVRAANDTLYKATCDGLTCTAFTLFPGQFGSQPTVYWDENIQRYVLWGRAANNSVWRSTFDRFGNFFNDWQPLPGQTASPPGAAGGGIVNTFNSTNGSMTPIQLSGTVVNIHSHSSNDVPFDGFVNCTGTGTIQHFRSATGNNAFARIYITQTSGGAAAQWIFTDLPSSQPTGSTSFPFATSRWFSVSAGTHAFYLTGEASTAAGTDTDVYNATFTCEYYPYAF